MKKLLIFVLLLTPSLIKAQEKAQLPITDGIVSYSDVVQVESLKKDELYTGCRNWFTTSFRTAKKSWLKIDKRTDGEMTGTATVEVKHKDLIADKFYDLSFTVSILVKDGRYKYTFSDIELIDLAIKNGNYKTLDPKVDLLKQQDIVDNDKSGKKTAEKIINMVNAKIKEIAGSIKSKVAASDF